MSKACCEFFKKKPKIQQEEQRAKPRNRNPIDPIFEFHKALKIEVSRFEIAANNLKTLCAKLVLLIHSLKQKQSNNQDNSLNISNFKKNLTDETLKQTYQIQQKGEPEILDKQNSIYNSKDGAIKQNQDIQKNLKRQDSRSSKSSDSHFQSQTNQKIDVQSFYTGKEPNLQGIVQACQEKSDLQILWLLRRFLFLSGIYTAHSKTEDDVIFPALDNSSGSKQNRITLKYEHDHQLEEQLLSDIYRNFIAIYFVKDLEQRYELAQKLASQAQLLGTSTATHLYAEERDLWPLCSKKLSESQQINVVGEIIGMTGGEILQAMIMLQSGEDRESMERSFRGATQNTHFDTWLESLQDSMKQQQRQHQEIQQHQIAKKCDELPQQNQGTSQIQESSSLQSQQKLEQYQQLQIISDRLTNSQQYLHDHNVQDSSQGKGHTFKDLNGKNQYQEQQFQLDQWLEQFAIEKHHQCIDCKNGWQQALEQQLLKNIEQDNLHTQNHGMQNQSKIDLSLVLQEGVSYLQVHNSYNDQANDQHLIQNKEVQDSVSELQHNIPKNQFSPLEKSTHQAQADYNDQLNQSDMKQYWQLQNWKLFADNCIDSATFEEQNDFQAGWQDIFRINQIHLQQRMWTITGDPDLESTRKDYLLKSLRASTYIVGHLDTEIAGPLQQISDSQQRIELGQIDHQEDSPSNLDQVGRVDSSDQDNNQQSPFSDTKQSTQKTELQQQLNSEPNQSDHVLQQKLPENQNQHQQYQQMPTNNQLSNSHEFTQQQKKQKEAQLSQYYNDQFEYHSLDNIKSYNDNQRGTLGCQHYKRNCQLISPCCDKIYPCRLCHDDIEDHAMNFYDVNHMICMKCGLEQPVSDQCKGCKTVMSRYYCGICKLFDNEPNRDIYHCPSCNMCRRGRGLGIDYFHCMNCNACMSLKLFKKHKCREKSLEAECPVCRQDIFTSHQPIKELPCGHFMHSICFAQYTQHYYTCPICQKSIGNMLTYFKMIDTIMQQESMPEEYLKRTQKIYCNDCAKQSTVQFHFVYHKCQYCKSYNTRLI